MNVFERRLSFRFRVIFFYEIALGLSTTLFEKYEKNGTKKIRSKTA